MERKVRIISISGQPLSGKSTAINAMKEKLQEDGINKENIHIVSVGKLFREYFNNIMDLAKNAKNQEIFEKLAVQDNMKRIFNKDSEYRKPMLEALGKLSKSGFDFENYDIEKANNSEELKEVRDLIDTIVDKRTEELGKEIVEKNSPDEVWIFDSRLAFSNIPESFAVRLTVRDDVAGKRLTNQDRKETEKEKFANIDEAINKAIKRRDGEEKRYNERYGVNLSDENNYDLIIDTSFSDVKDIAETVLKCEEKYRDGKYFGKYWTSPKTLLPTQPYSETMDRDDNEEYIELLKENIKKYGFDPYEVVVIFEFDGRKYLEDGNHRYVAMAELGKTMIPYVHHEMKESSCEMCSHQTNIRDLNLYVRHFRKVDPNFSYEEIYPGIIELALKDELGFYRRSYSYKLLKENDPEKYKKEIEEMVNTAKGKGSIDKVEEER